MKFTTLALSLTNIVAASTINANASIPKVKITVNTQLHHQQIDGFGISQAFQRARQVQQLSPSQQKKALDLLFSTETGAGLTILRNGIGSSADYTSDFMKSIAPKAPSSANASLTYEWDGDDAGQVWFTREALKRAGAELTVYADAWSTPGYMKTNGKDTDGGSICGVRDASCATGDWRKAYAEYLIQLVRFYKEKENITISHLGFLNEPDLNQTYASMQSSGFQAADFLQVLRPILDASEFKGAVKVVCCEATGWGDGQDILAELQSVPGAESTVDVYAAHGYSVHPALPYATRAKVWQTEWADLDGKWNTAWDNLGKEGEGISWANKIHQGLTLSNISGFLHWIGVETGNVNSALVRIDNGTVIPSKRLWAFGQYSRFVRPGAVRVEAESDVGFVRVSAFLNRDGKVAVQVINNGHTEVEIEMAVLGAQGKREMASRWRTGNDVELEKGVDVPVKGTNGTSLGFVAGVKKREMVSFVL